MSLHFSQFDFFSDIRGSNFSLTTARQLIGSLGLRGGISDDYVALSKPRTIRGLHAYPIANACEKIFLVLSGSVRFMKVSLDDKAEFDFEKTDAKGPGTVSIFGAGEASGYIAEEEGAMVWSCSTVAYSPDIEIVVNPIPFLTMIDVGAFRLSEKDLSGITDPKTFMALLTGSPY